MPSAAEESLVQIHSQAQAGPSTVPSTSTAPAAASAAGPSLAPAAPPPPPALKGPHLMRIATQGRIKNYREFALKFLQENPSRPLVLHTLPPLASVAAPRPPPSTSDAPKKPKPPATTTIPMLVSTVENVKRAYLDLYAASLAKGKGREHGPEPLLGLWQYNETGCLEDLEEYRVLLGERDELAEAERALERLKDVLGGKTGPRMQHTPYLKVTLSTRPLPDLADQERVTYQHVPLPPAPKRTKAKARAKRRALQVEGREKAMGASRVNAEASEVGAPASAEARGGPLTALAQKISKAANPAAAPSGAAAPAKRRVEELPEGAGAKKKKKVAA